MASPPAIKAMGFTLLELMIALVIGLLVVLAALAALLGAQRGYSTVDASSQLRDNAIFAVDLTQRLALQAGYQDLTTTTISRDEYRTTTGIDPDPDVTGYNNAIVNVATLPVISDGSRTSGCGGVTDSSCVNGSDVLVLRFYGSSEITPGVADGSIINCAGTPEKALANGDLTTRAYNIFYVAVSSGEPTLMCAYRDDAGSFQSVPLVGGVESFQVLYGLYGVAADGTLLSPSLARNIPTLWLRADQINASSLPKEAWRRVQRLRIGMVLRGPPNTAGDRASTAAHYYPFGAALATTNDPGTDLNIATADGRIRRTAAFTLYLRNPLNADILP